MCRALAGHTMRLPTLLSALLLGLVACHTPENPGMQVPDAGRRPLQAPIGLVATVVSSAELRLSWRMPPESLVPAGFILKRDRLAVATLADFSFSDTGLLPSMQYCYVVVAYSANEES